MGGSYRVYIGFHALYSTVGLEGMFYLEEAMKNWFRNWFTGAGFYRLGMFIGAVGVAVFLGIGVFYVVDYFTRFIIPAPWNLISSIFVAAFIEYKAVSLFLNGFQALSTIRETHERRKEQYEQRTNMEYNEWSGEWAVWAQFLVVVIMDTAGNLFRIWVTQQEWVRSIGAFIIYECLVFLPFLAGYSIYKQTTKPVEMVKEDYERKWDLLELEEEDSRKTKQFKQKTRLLPQPEDVQPEFEEETSDFPQARRVK